jgi:hypothetical protein
MSYRLLNKNLFIVSHPHPAPPPEREGKLLPSSPLEGRKTETSSPFKGEAGGGWGFERAISPLW